MDPYKVVIVFRKYKNGGDILALMPYEAELNYQCECYQHLGQHGIADYSHCIEITSPAKPHEYANLKRELEQHFNYVIEVRQKVNYDKVSESRKLLRSV